MQQKEAIVQRDFGESAKLSFANLSISLKSADLCELC